MPVIKLQMWAFVLVSMKGSPAIVVWASTRAIVSVEERFLYRPHRMVLLKMRLTGGW